MRKKKKKKIERESCLILEVVWIFNISILAIFFMDTHLPALHPLILWLFLGWSTWLIWEKIKVEKERMSE